MKRLPLLLVSALALPAGAAWVPTADSTTSAPKFTDGNFVVSWNTSNKQLKYVSHDSTVSTVCDLSTLSEDVDAVAGYSHPTQVAASGFQSKSGITRVVLPEIAVELTQTAPDRWRVAVRDNGPGIGCVVECYENEIVFHARNFATGAWLPAYDAAIPVQ